VFGRQASDGKEALNGKQPIRYIFIFSPYFSIKKKQKKKRRK
jgi:hypothetical protein